MAGHELIDAYLADLARRLPGELVDELADGLNETWQHHRHAGLDSTAAAQATIAEFGSLAQVTNAFVRLAPGRHTARLLLATGPLLGAAWGASLALGHAWTWPVHILAAASYLLLFLVVVAALITAATSHHNYRRTHLGTLGAYGLIALDMGMIAATLHLAPTLTWPMAVAIPASLTRIILALGRTTRRAAV
jgi:hypothetical protein